MTGRISNNIKALRCQRWAYFELNGVMIHQQCENESAVLSIVTGRLTLKTCTACHYAREQEARADNVKRD